MPDVYKQKIDMAGKFYKQNSKGVGADIKSKQAANGTVKDRQAKGQKVDKRMAVDSMGKTFN